MYSHDPTLQFLLIRGCNHLEIKLTGGVPWVFFAHDMAKRRSGSSLAMWHYTRSDHGLIFSTALFKQISLIVIVGHAYGRDMEGTLRTIFHASCMVCRNLRAFFCNFCIEASILEAIYCLLLESINISKAEPSQAAVLEQNLIYLLFQHT